MTKQEIIDYMYENHVQGDFKIEEMAEDLLPNIAVWEHEEDYGEDAYVCSWCQTIWITGQIKNMHYCPTCGADMREGEDNE